MSSNPKPSYVPHGIFAQIHLQINTPARQLVHVHQKPVSQAKQTSCDKPQGLLKDYKDGLQPETLADGNWL
jgi:hypothetical protein